MKLKFKIQRIGRTNTSSQISIVYFRGMERVRDPETFEVTRRLAMQAAYSLDYADLVHLRKL
jgi:hypothetical protein